MNNKDYNYEIEKLLTQYGDKPDSGEERICGNCFLYDADHWRCCHYENAEDGGFYDQTESGCWYHRTHEEQKRLVAYIKKHCDEADRLRLDEQRRNGTGDCEGCPFRETYKKQLDKMWEFVKAVQDMRDTQKVYFKTREILTRSKSLEAKVDVMADEMIDMIGDATPTEEQEQQ